jgi:hypothetical protein
MLTMKLLNKACTGLYPEWIYKFYAKVEVGLVLESTAYILDLPHCAAAYRTIIVQFYACFRIFPNDSLMTFRMVSSSTRQYCHEGSRTACSRVTRTARSSTRSSGARAAQAEQVWRERSEGRRSPTTRGPDLRRWPSS